MHHLLRKCCLVCVLFLLCSCQNKEVWTWQKWCTELALKGGFSTDEKIAIDELKSFDIVDVSMFDCTDSLTGEMVEMTCESLLDEYDFNTMCLLLDLENIEHDDVLTEKEAEKVLNWLVEQMNSFDKEMKSDFVYVTEPMVVTVLERNGNWLKLEQTVQIDDLIQVDDDVYRVIEMNEEWVLIHELTYEDFSEIDISGNMTLDIEKTQFLIHDEIIEVDQSLGAGQPVFKLSQSFQIQGFNVRFSTSSDSIHVYVSKKMNSGFPIFAQFDINQIDCDFKWKSKQDDVETASMKVSYETSFTSGLRSTHFDDRVLDFSKIDSTQPLSSLQSALVKQTDCLEETIELAEIQIPFTNLPTCHLKMKVLLHLYAGGKAEIAFESNHELGFERINGKLRLIHDTEKDSHLSLRASAKATTQLQFLVSILGQDCMDVAAEVGIQATASTKASMVETGEIAKFDVPYEIAQAFSEENEELLVCADLDAYWLVHLILNSNRTVLGSFGLGKTFDIVDQSNGSIFGKAIHLENFQRVERCTRNKKNTTSVSLDVSTDRIELKQYLLVLDCYESQMIDIGALPENVKLTDLRYSCLNQDIVKVSSSGKVTAIQSGQTKVIISSKDGKYEVQCSIFVR